MDRDRSAIVAVAVLTVPLAWYALAGGAQGDSGAAALQGQPPSSARAAAPSVAPPSVTPGPGSTTTASTGATPGPSAAATPTADSAVVDRGSGSWDVVAGSTRASGPGRLITYSVAVEGGLGVDAPDVAAQVDRTLADPRSWGHTGTLAFRRVDSGPVDVKVVLASPDTTDRLCRPLDTAGIYSCGNGNTAVLNSMRWLRGADAYAGRLPEYRQYVVNHEVGHTIGHGHEQCRTAGALAPVMMQQTKGVGACLPSPWPYP